MTPAEICERLRGEAFVGCGCESCENLKNAIELLESQQREIAQLREALTETIEYARQTMPAYLYNRCRAALN